MSSWSDHSAWRSYDEFVFIILILRSIHFAWNDAFKYTIHVVHTLLLTVIIADLDVYVDSEQWVRGIGESIDRVLLGRVHSRNLRVSFLGHN